MMNTAKEQLKDYQDAQAKAWAVKQQDQHKEQRIARYQADLSERMKGRLLGKYSKRAVKKETHTSLGAIGGYTISAAAAVGVAGAEVGTAMFPGVGTIVGGAGGALVGGLTTMTGWLVKSKIRDANRNKKIREADELIKFFAADMDVIIQQATENFLTEYKWFISQLTDDEKNQKRLIEKLAEKGIHYVKHHPLPDNATLKEKVALLQKGFAKGHSHLPKAKLHTLDGKAKSTQQFFQELKKSRPTREVKNEFVGARVNTNVDSIIRQIQAP